MSLEHLVEIDNLLEDAKFRSYEMLSAEPKSRERARAAVDIHQILSKAHRLHKLHGSTADQREHFRELANTVVQDGFGLTPDSTTPHSNLSGVVSRGGAVSIELRSVVTCGCTVFWHNKQTLGGILQEFAPEGADSHWGLRAVDKLRNKGKLDRHNLPVKGCDGCGT